MTFKIREGLEICVYFTHVELNDDKYSHQTECTICKPDLTRAKREEWPVMAKGVARCSRLDNYNRSKGNKLALARALPETSLSKAERLVFWAQYFERTGRHSARALIGVRQELSKSLTDGLIKVALKMGTRKTKRN